MSKQLTFGRFCQDKVINECYLYAPWTKPCATMEYRNWKLNMGVCGFFGPPFKIRLLHQSLCTHAVDKICEFHIGQDRGDIFYCTVNANRFSLQHHLHINVVTVCWGKCTTRGDSIKRNSVISICLWTTGNPDQNNRSIHDFPWIVLLWMCLSASPPPYTIRLLFFYG